MSEGVVMNGAWGGVCSIKGGIGPVMRLRLSRVGVVTGSA